MKTPSPKTVVIVGGVAGGASCAARLRHEVVTINRETREMDVRDLASGRSYRRHGFDAANLSGGYTTFRHATAAPSE
jgi:hypothetical protein